MFQAIKVKRAVMRKKAILVFSLVGAMMISTTAASAASVDMPAPAPVEKAPAITKASSQAAAKLALADRLAFADMAGAQQSSQNGLPARAKPKPKKKSNFFAFSMLGLLAAGGVAAAASSGGSSSPASP